MMNFWKWLVLGVALVVLYWALSGWSVIAVWEDSVLMYWHGAVIECAEWSCWINAG